MNTEPKTSLTQKTEMALRQRITDESLRAGDKLPTEKVLAAEFGVSRTVIREAVAALRADGLLEAKHGVGVFVSPKAAEGAADGQNPSTLTFTASTIDLLELRMAVEVHAAGLAAERRSWAQEARIFSAADAFARAIAAEEPTEDADWAFHRSISEASNNEAFVEFFVRLGLSILPRRALLQGQPKTLITRQYLEKSAIEHHAICEAIAAGDAKAAREAMKNHIGGSQARYRGLLHAGRIPVAPQKQLDDSEDRDTITNKR